MTHESASYYYSSHHHHHHHHINHIAAAYNRLPAHDHNDAYHHHHAGPYNASGIHPRALGADLPDSIVTEFLASSGDSSHKPIPYEVDWVPVQTPSCSLRTDVPLLGGYQNRYGDPTSPISPDSDSGGSIFSTDGSG